jgi:hypothetical protein
MRITDIALSTTTPVGTPRTGTRRTDSGSAGAPAPASAGRTDSASHPDEVAAAKLQKAAGAAQAGRVVAAENQRASESVRGEIDLSRVLQPSS